MTGFNSRMVAVLGPTNTGKTRYALERMLAYRTGVIGLPLRLLAREVYDRTVRIRGPSVVALVTGEERIVPPRTQYWVATTEAMPVGVGADFLAVDEIQLCSDPERGHVFTDRLLHARGLKETMFLGSGTMRDAIVQLVPDVRIQYRERLSRLSYGGRKKISRMRPRSAIVGFSVDDVYSIAEWVRQRRGGAAVVMGALSPRTRNAQVRMYQGGEVDFLVATDAIGMGLNLDVDHVAFAGLAKFDGRRVRRLQPNELAQIAGRAGRYRNDGSFGETGEAPPIEADVVAAIETNRFQPVRRLQWRNGDLDFASVGSLIESLEAVPSHPELCRTREADDVRTLKSISTTTGTAVSVASGKDVRLLWETCQIPDFRQVSLHDHANLVKDVYLSLRDNGEIPEHWLSEQVSSLDRTDGDIDTLSRRLAFIRTWTYVVQRRGWVADEEYWRGWTREVEDRISDVLHLALTNRFVDRRASVLMRRLERKEQLMAEIDSAGEVSVEGQHVGRIDGFRFKTDPEVPSEFLQTLNAAANQALTPELARRAHRLYSASNQDMEINGQGELVWNGWVVGKLELGADVLSPVAKEYVDEAAGPQVSEMVRRRLQHFVLSHFAAVFAPLVAMRDDEAIAGIARGVAHRLVGSLGVLPRSLVAEEVRELDQDNRKLIRKHGVRFGQRTIFVHSLLKPAPTRLRILVWALQNRIDPVPDPPTPGRVVFEISNAVPRAFYSWAGFRVEGKWALRADMWERVMDLIRVEDNRNGFEASTDMLSLTGMSHAGFADFMGSAGFSVEQGERVKRRAQPEKSDSQSPENADGSDIPAPEADGEDASAAGDESDRNVENSGAVSANEAESGGKPDAAADPRAELNGTDNDDPPVAEDELAEASRSDPERKDDSPPDPVVEAPPETIETYYVFRRLPPKRPRKERKDRPVKKKGRPSKVSGRRDKPKPAPEMKREKVEHDPSNPFSVLAALRDDMSEKPGQRSN